jgi:hypothetical protein
VVRWDTIGQDPLLEVCGSSVMVEFATGIKVRVTSRKVAKLAGSYGEPAHDVCVGSLSVSDRKAGVDLQRLAAGMT